MIAEGMTAAGERRWAARFGAVARHYQRRQDKLRDCPSSTHWAEVAEREAEAQRLDRTVA